LPLAGERAAAHGPRDRAAFSEPRLEGVRVLAVDDEPDARDFVGEVLRRTGAEVRLAGSVAEALEVLAQFAADVLIADVEMPSEDGYALLQRVRAAGHEMPAIALTAHSSAEDRVRALEAGFLHHVPKPVDPAELQLVVANAALAADGSRSQPR
jgi:CheY-like chemotaxis protein